MNELAFVALYLLSFSSPILSPELLADVPDIFANPHSAGARELARANKMDSTIPWILFTISFPVMVMKQLINVVQLVKASRWLAEGDVEARRAQGLPRRKKE